MFYFPSASEFYLFSQLMVSCLIMLIPFRVLVSSLCLVLSVSWKSFLSPSLTLCLYSRVPDRTLTVLSSSYILVWVSVFVTSCFIQQSVVPCALCLVLPPLPHQSDSVQLRSHVSPFPLINCLCINCMSPLVFSHVLPQAVCSVRSMVWVV